MEMFAVATPLILRATAAPPTTVHVISLKYFYCEQYLVVCEDKLITLLICLNATTNFKEPDPPPPSPRRLPVYTPNPRLIAPMAAQGLCCCTGLSIAIFSVLLSSCDSYMSQMGLLVLYIAMVCGFTQTSTLCCRIYWPLVRYYLYGGRYYLTT